MSLTSLPEGVFYHYIFTKIKINDTVRLRRVCKTLKPFADAYLRVRHVTQEREINEQDHSFSEFIRRDLPSSRIYLNNSDATIFEQPEAGLFLEKYGNQVTHLRVRYFATCVSPAEKKFYVSLKNLQHLELHYIDATDRYWVYIPPNFRNLKILLLHDMKSRNEYYYYDLVRCCVNLEHLKHPRFLNKTQGFGTCRPGAYDCVTMEMKNKCVANRRCKTPLQVFDLKNHLEGGVWNAEHVLGLYHLIQFAELQGFHLANVDSELIDEPVIEEMDSLAKTLISVRNLSGWLFQTEMPLLEMLKVTTLKRVDFQYERWRVENENGEQVKWPRLRELDVNIDSEKTAGWEPCFAEGEPSRGFVRFLFESMKRPNLTTLKLAFDSEGIRGTRTQALPCPKALKIVENCGNLKVLYIYNWLGTNKALSLLWEGLQKLEDVTLDKCQMMGNVAFVGEYIGEPTFLKLKNLQQFSLLGLDHMPKITDTAFQLVFKHLKIKKFCITSKNPINTVTVNGIRALTGGSFQNSVEKIPFAGWSLNSVTEKERNKLKHEFRATYML